MAATCRIALVWPAFALFVTAMTAARSVGPGLLDTHGRVIVLRATMPLASVGILLVPLGGNLVLAGIGIVLWGTGASLGFPVGLAAAADDEAHAPARVSIVPTIGYAAFLAGPPLLGFVAEQVGALDALRVVAVLSVPSALLVPAAAKAPGDAARARPSPDQTGSVCAPAPVTRQ